MIWQLGEAREELNTLVLTLKGQRKDQELHSNSNSNWHLLG